MEGECDYMSDDFLTACASADVRPGLIHNRVKQREHDIQKKKQIAAETHRRNHPSLKQLETDLLSKGLEQPIGPENKGFAMLQKMGFKPGSSLGSKESGIKEPIAINVKNDRKGLGREEALRDIQARKKMYRERHKLNKSQALSVEDFRANMSKKHKEREVLSDLLKSQKAAYKLDSEIGMIKPEEVWFWPEHCLPDKVGDDGDETDEEEHEDEGIEFPPSDKLEMLALYLRKSYYYCIWCGIQYADEKDLSDCPGPTRDDH